MSDTPAASAARLDAEAVAHSMALEGQPLPDGWVDEQVERLTSQDCKACEWRRDKERRTGHVCDKIVPDLPTCPRCGKPLRDPPLPPGRYVLSCGAKVVVDESGWVTEDAD